jgi:transposase-like protein
MINFPGSHFEKEIILWAVRCYVASPMSYRQLEEMMQERGGAVDPPALNRWVITYAPEIEKQFRLRKQLVGKSCRLDESYVKIKGKWASRYRAVDKVGQTVDFLLPPQQDRAAAEAFLRKAIRHHGVPEKITIDQRGGNTAAIQRYNRNYKISIAIRQCQYLNTIVEQDHRVVKRKVTPTSGFKFCWAARCTIAGIEVMQAIHNGQFVSTGKEGATPAEHFSSVAA